jgi:hypothetical protein
MPTSCCGATLAGACRQTSAEPAEKMAARPSPAMPGPLPCGLVNATSTPAGCPGIKPSSPCSPPAFTSGHESPPSAAMTARP